MNTSPKVARILANVHENHSRRLESLHELNESSPQYKTSGISVHPADKHIPVFGKL